MKVAFWSNAYDKSRAFSNFVAVSIASVIWYPYTITLLENYLGKENLGKVLSVDNQLIYDKGVTTGYYEGKGIEGLLRRIYRGENYSGLLKNYWREIIPNHLYYIPQQGVINSELFDYELYYNLYELVSIIDKNTDLCYINLNHQNHLSSNAFLQGADLIVVNLYQNQDYLNEFFKNFSSLIPKSIFIVGNYSPKSPLSCKRMARLYDIPLEDISPIPYNAEFQVACESNGAKEFINSNYFCNKKDPNYLFVLGIRRAAFLISKKLKECYEQTKEEVKNCGI